MSDAQQLKNNRQIAFWLLVCCAMIFVMVVLGGVTRLTRSGLSMVSWHPIMGIIPPIGDAQWLEEFNKYKQFPEYQKLNQGMSLHDFKFIFAFEYSHRVLGRLIGVAFLLPFLYFLIRKKIPATMTPKLIIMFALGALQGLLGWYMVKSGLVDKPYVSQYRLTAHLIAAMMIYAYMLWTALGLLYPTANYANQSWSRSLRRFGIGLTALIIIMILSGGFVAGTHAGFILNTFPLMGDRFIPEGLFNLSPWYLNAFENLVTIQFNHRMIAYALAILIPAFWFVTRRNNLTNRTKTILNYFLIMLVIQIALGISTLLLVIPVPLAAAHQGGALLLLTAALFVNHEFRANS